VQSQQLDVTIPAGDSAIAAICGLAPNALGIVIFAHGSGSSRFSMRNQFVARTLQQANLATLLLDLLTPEEEEYDRRTTMLRFDVAFLAQRLEAAIHWASRNSQTKELGVGLFGASTGAAAALISAAKRPKEIRAVVSRGGRPDLAGASLERVQAPTLLIVGGNDPQVVELNAIAARSLKGVKETFVIEGATHLFEEPGALERVADLARAWFLRYLLPAGTAT
jgi:pimeloyl-ACP methyl ester carboxylesterase